MDNDSRLKLIEAATILFAQKGLAGVSIREIAKQAGVNSALISYHFEGKEGLYAAVLEHQLFFMSEIVKRISNDHLSPSEQIKEYANAVLGLHQRSPMLVRFIYSELFNPSPCFEMMKQKFFAKLFQALKGTITEGIAKGQFRADLNPEKAVISLVGIMNFYFISRPITKNIITEDTSDQQYIDQAVEIYLRGIVRRG